ncbi:hypothetical protein [Burkholderia anthina]|uniref:hypothetical protein n=1 Tax=Burkholderia anthina TaxID=179879 RepID=UPI00158A52AF|nr:hypothetical protein [Burkholderia anthina]
MNKPLTDEQILAAFRDAGIDLNATPNMIYTVRGQQAQLVNAVRALLAAQQPKPRAEVTDDDVAKLKRFAGLVLKDHRNGGYPGEVDGGELQAYAEQCGLIEERRVESPCGENCSCTDFGEFPTTCYFNTDLGKAVINAARAGEPQ